MTENLSTKQKKIVIIVGIILIIGIMYYIYNNIDTNNVLEENILVQDSNETIKDEKTEEMEEENIVVHITGAIKNPRNCKIRRRVKD